jgi:hypothetical protein
MIERSRGQSPKLLDHALDSLLTAVTAVKLDRAAVLAVGCGALVDGDAGSEHAYLGPEHIGKVRLSETAAALLAWRH